ncbi:MAG: hypothetical protein A2945_02080 [Candidatus Liptonbacteria bacterium RIFCSPLOWO2_01_FULL_52_25]|uniref:Uncharacterized protein n=1 Tax=Candidatus Liptonbacteria bacterium RIFCSPLOWO2_01_FULL_52_25 TaxID=1798650 RepID=A0A1G2CED6_9BACT|nr:MAG: hypothetical protein A2945_02080 [Candidatus Liptonbacteria bacterium RIFCSPLOWO2_01_FULL_52_25]
MTRTVAVRYVLGKTLSGEAIWHEKSGGGYACVIYRRTPDEMRVEIGTSYSRTGGKKYIFYSLIKLDEAGEPHETYAEESGMNGPLGRVLERWFDKNYADNREFADELEKLHAAVRRQCAERVIKAMEEADKTEQEIYKRLPR